MRLQVAMLSVVQDSWSACSQRPSRQEACNVSPFLCNTLSSVSLMVRLQSEAKPPEEAFNPTVKRSGWRPPADTGLWKPAEVLRARVWESLGKEQVALLRAEMAFFDAVTGVSGQLYPVAKENRRAKAAEFLAVCPLHECSHDAPQHEPIICCEHAIFQVFKIAILPFAHRFSKWRGCSSIVVYQCLSHPAARDQLFWEQHQQGSSAAACTT